MWTPLDHHATDLQLKVQLFSLKVYKINSTLLAILIGTASKGFNNLIIISYKKEKTWNQLQTYADP